MRIKRIEARCEGDKRQKVPFVIEWDCPKCGAAHINDLSGQHHLSHHRLLMLTFVAVQVSLLGLPPNRVLRAEVSITIGPCKDVLEDKGPVCAACDYPINEGYPAVEGPDDERCPVCGAPC